MKYAIIKIGGKQYKVSEGDVIEVNKLPLKKDDKIVVEDVLFSYLDGKIEIGKPRVLGIQVKALVVDQKKGEKIHVSKFKAKARQRRTIGFRPLFTCLKIEKIESSKESKTPLKQSRVKTKKS